MSEPEPEQVTTYARCAEDMSVEVLSFRRAERWPGAAWWEPALRRFDRLGRLISVIGGGSQYSTPFDWNTTVSALSWLRAR